jgi:Domain of unknown function (DUF4260)
MAGRRDLPTLFLRTEGAVLLALATFLYARREGGWLLFLVLLLVPDVGILGYVRGTRVGAVVYNIFHTYLPPAALAVVGILSGSRLPVLIALIWFAHIGMDRMLGYGLKETSDFRDTHLGRIGRARARRSAGG